MMMMPRAREELRMYTRSWIPPSTLLCIVSSDRQREFTNLPLKQRQPNGSLFRVDTTGNYCTYIHIPLSHVHNLKTREQQQLMLWSPDRPDTHFWATSEWTMWMPQNFGHRSYIITTKWAASYLRRPICMSNYRWSFWVTYTYDKEPIYN